MDGSLLLILLGLGALLALSDVFSSSSSDDTATSPDDDVDDETQEEPSRPPLVMGTQGDDLIFSGGGEVVRGWSGDDTLITDGDSTLRGGSGDDTLMSIGGGALLRGGDGEDTFIIAPVDFTEDGELLNRSGATVDPTLIADFNPDEDRLVLDLRGSAFVPADDEPVILTGVAAPDGDGLMVQMNGVNVVQLSGYGGDDMQAALEDLVEDFDALDIVGAEFVFPEGDDMPAPPSPFPTGLTVTEEDNGDVVIVLTDGFQGGGNYVGGDEFNTLDLSALTQDMSVTVLGGDVIVVEPTDGSLPATTFEQIDRVILGNGDDVFDGSAGSGFVEAVAGNGTDRLVGSDSNNQNVLNGAGFMRIDGDADIIDGTGETRIIGGAGNDILSGGLGDTLTGGPGADAFQIYGVGAEGAGPALITDFNPFQFDRLVYTPVNLNGSNPSPEVIVQQDDFSTSIIENGEVMVVLQGIGSFYDVNITINEPVTRLPV